VPRFEKAPKLDGSFENWQDVFQMEMLNAKVNGKDASGVAYLGWDEEYLDIGLDLRDNQIYNTSPLGKIYREDSMEIFISGEVREEHKGYGPHDHQYWVAPTSQENEPMFKEVLESGSGTLGEVEGARRYIGESKIGWVTQIAIPWSAYPTINPTPGAEIALELRVNDADKSHPRWKLDPPGVSVSYADPTSWSILRLAE
jgi:hypothetical protein